MYAVIMAGGGGTRLHPLSRPERPKPFLPLLPSGETLLQATARRLPGRGTTVTVVTERRYERFVRDQLPDAHVLLEPMGRNTAAAIAFAAIAIDKPDDEVMLVVPADAYIDPTSEGVYTSVLDKAERLATDAFDVDGPLVTFGVQASRPATEYGYLIPKLDTERDVSGLTAYQLDRFEEKPTQERAQMLLKEPGVAWNAGIFLWRRQRDHGGARAVHRSPPDAPSDGGRADAPRDGVRGDPAGRSIDHAVMESAARNGQVVMGAMDVGWSDLGSWTALLAAIGAPATGPSCSPARPPWSTHDDLVVRRVDGRLGVIAPPRAR